VTINDDNNKWSQICQGCLEKHKFDEKDADCFISWNEGHGICGVEGCNNESDHYIDFSDDILREVR